jgi:RNA polymerase sigma factor (TIGR02999 family)
MRRILVENARRKHRIKRGGDRQRVNLEDANLAFEVPSEDIIAVNEALFKLSEEDPVVADLVKLWYFAGLTLEQTAGILGISRRTAHRYWDYARAWLHQQIAEGDTRFSGS